MFDFLYMIHSIRSYLSIIFLVIWVVILIILKVTKKRTRIISLGMVLLIVPTFIIFIQFYNVHLKPEHSKIGLSEQKIVEFCDDALISKSLINPEKFLQNNTKEYYKPKENSEIQSLHYAPNCRLQYFLWTFDNSDDAQQEFDREKTRYKEHNEKCLYIQKENYCVFVPPVENNVAFFNGDVADYNSKEVNIYLKLDKYVVLISEETERSKPLLYKLINKKLLFNNEFKLKTLADYIDITY